MAAINLGAMKTRLLSEVNKSSTASQGGVTFDTHAENQIIAAIRSYEGRHFTFLEGSDTPTLSSGAYQEALPSNFKTPLEIRLKDANNRWKGENDGFKQETLREVLDKRYDTTQREPACYTIFDGNLQFDSYADQDYELELYYLKGDATLPNNDTLSSVYFDDGREMILSRAKDYFYRDVLHDTDMADSHARRALEWERILEGKQNRRKGGRLK